MLPVISTFLVLKNRVGQSSSGSVIIRKDGSTYIFGTLVS
jgi:hypothetical protein